MGRLLITLVPCAEGVLAEPVLHLTLFFKSHRSDYGPLRLVILPPSVDPVVDVSLVKFDF